MGDTPRPAYPNPDPDPILDYRLEPALDRMLEPVGDDRMLEPACMPCIDQSCTSWTTCNYPECNRVVRFPGPVASVENAQGHGTPDTRGTRSGFEPSGSPCKSSSPVVKAMPTGHSRYIPRSFVLLTNQTVQKQDSRNCIAIAALQNSDLYAGLT